MGMGKDGIIVMKEVKRRKAMAELALACGKNVEAHDHLEVCVALMTVLMEALDE